MCRAAALGLLLSADTASFVMHNYPLLFLERVLWTQLVLARTARRRCATTSVSSSPIAQARPEQALSAIVDNPITLYCLNMFLTKNLSINNLVFVLEDLAIEMRHKINLTVKQFVRITYVQKGTYVLQDSVFAEALVETWNFIERNIYKQFLTPNWNSSNQMRSSTPVLDDRSMCEVFLVWIAFTALLLALNLRVRCKLRTRLCLRHQLRIQRQEHWQDSTKSGHWSNRSIVASEWIRLKGAK